MGKTRRYFKTSAYGWVPGNERSEGPVFWIWATAALWPRRPRAGFESILALFSAIGLCFLVSADVNAQQIAPAPLPPTHYAAWANDADTVEAAAEAESDKKNDKDKDKEKKEEKDELDFLDKPLSEISQTQVSAPSSAALSSNIETVSRTTQPLARTAAAAY